MEIKENVRLCDFTSFKVGGVAKHFTEVTSIEELKQALDFAKQKNVPVFILGGGTNLIVSDDGFDGLVILVKIDFLNIEDDIVEVGAGTSMKKLIGESIKAGLKGVEWAGGLPGTVGGAIRGNAGAFGGEIKDKCIEVTSVNPETTEQKTYNHDECQFGYRDSIFKQSAEIIISAKFRFEKGDIEELRKIADSKIAFRQEKHPMEYPSAGSVFKNTPVDKVPKEHLAIFESSIKTDPFPVVPTAKIIAEAGLAGLKEGNAEVSTKHTNYIINAGGATSADILKLIDKVKSAVKEKFGIDLEIEQQIVE